MLNCCATILAMVVSGSAAVRTEPEPSPSGTRFYVSPAGADADSGTESKPWQTLKKAYEAAQPGDTIVLGEGVYREAPFLFQKSGTADKPLRIEAAKGADVVLTYPKSGPKMEDNPFDNYLADIFKGKRVVYYDSVAVLAASHVHIRGIAFEGWHDKTDAVSNFAGCSGLEIGGQGNVLQHCTFRGNGHCGIKVGASDLRIEDCRICDNGTTGYDHGIYVNEAAGLTLRRNLFENNQGFGIKGGHGNPRDLVIEDNVLRRNGHGILIEGHRFVVRRNIFAWNGRKDCGKEAPLMGGMVFRGPNVADNLIEENVFLGNSTAFSFDAMGKGFGKNNIVRKNVFYSQPLDLAAGGVSSPRYPYKPVLTDEQAIAEARKFGIIALTKAKDNLAQLQRDLKDAGIAAAFGDGADAEKHQFIFQENVFRSAPKASAGIALPGNR